MVDWQRLKARYDRLSWQHRLGNLASTLARSATASTSSRSITSVPDLLREGMWIIEWSAPDAPLDVLADLAPMQLELGLLRSSWAGAAEAVQPLLAHRVRVMSNRVLEFSGLLNS